MIVSPSQQSALWAADAPLVLASRSATRRGLLQACGLTVEAMAVDLDERELEDRFLAGGGSVEGLAHELARAKAVAASATRPDAYCLGADQTLTVGARVFHKARDRAEAAQSLSALAGRTHRLTSAFCLARSAAALVIDSDSADLEMRALDEQAIQRYLDAAGPAALASVGVYQLEGLGVHLFERIRGDHFTILGLPLLKLLTWLRARGLLAI